MRAMILAAGRGERMRPLTDKIPKPLLQVGDKALIEYHLNALVNAGVSDVVINHSWLGIQIEQYLGTGSRYGINIKYSAEPDQPLETAGGIIQALPLLGPDPFIVVNGDIWTDYDFRQLRENSETNVHLVLVRNPEHNPQGDFGLSGGMVTLHGPKYTFSGISVFSPKFFRGLEAGVRALAPLLREAIQKNQVSGELFNGQWRDVGTPVRLSELDDYIRNTK